MKEKDMEVKDYEFPRVEVIDVEVERGFAASASIGGVGIGDWIDGGLSEGEAEELI